MSAFVLATPLSARAAAHGKQVVCAPAVPAPAPAPASAAAPRRAAVEMKKARFHAPLRPQRPDAAMKVPEDGTPVFSIFVRSPRSQIWFPLGAVTGDAKSKTLVNALKSGWGKALYQNSLDKGIAQTVYGKESGRFLQTALRQYPQLKRSEKVLEFGYRVTAKGLDDRPTRVVDRDMALPFVQWAKKQLDDALDGAKKSQSK
jgi:hypothetical protein